MSRIYTIDFVRCLAIVLMVIFHFAYDLKYFGYVSWDVPDGSGWRQFRYVILTLFFLCVGFSLAVVHNNGIKLKHFAKRLVLLVLAAAAVTASSLVMAPDNWIFFGVLHFIAVASVICVPFASYPKTAFVIGLAIIVVFNLGIFTSMWPFQGISHLLPSYTNDYVGMFPWTGVVLLGIWFSSVNQVKNDPMKAFGKPKWVAFSSRHSLIIYLLHQPFFFAIFGLIAFLK